jgi:hypothetical protein
MFGFTSFVATSAQASCGSAFCILNTNWSIQGVWVEPGARLDLRYEYVNQDELLESKKTSGATAEDHREQNTVNNNLQLTFDYAFNETYGITINAPVVSRKHTHFHLNEADPSASEKEVWDFSRMGDVRVVGRMQLSPNTSLHYAYGINVGVKLPTGDYQLTNSDNELAERSLQPGTGTTDVIVGGYYRQQLPSMNAQWFAQLAFIAPLNQSEQYQAGKQFTLDVGYNYKFTSQFNGMLQINYNYKNQDSGEQAEPENSGGNTYFLSPGLSYSVNKTTQFYSFVHHRLSQAVNGEQLSAKDSYVVGVSTRF